MIIVTILNPLTRSNPAHTMRNKNISRRNLAIKIGIFTYFLESNLSRIFSTSTYIIKNSPYFLGFFNKGSPVPAPLPFSIT